VPSPVLSARWIEKRQAHWARLESLLARARQRISALSHEELAELALLYRQTAADLSSAREHRADAQLASYLNQLLGRAHNVLIRVAPTPPRPRNFLRDHLPAGLPRDRPYTAAATLLFVAGGLAGTLLSLADPGFQRFLLGGEMMDTIERRQMWTLPILAVKPLASSAILTNNLSVAFMRLRPASRPASARRG
jgi:hypothetical protein